MNWMLIYDDRIQLSDDERWTYIKRFSHGLSVDEIAAQDGKQPEEVEAMLDETAERLREFADDPQGVPAR